MNRLLEILGRAITVDVAELIWHWLDELCHRSADTESAQYRHFLKILELVAAAKTDSAEEQLGLYLFENPSCARGKMASAALYLQKGCIESALEQLNDVYRSQPSNTMALYAIGHCLERLGEEDKSIHFYQDCLKFKSYLQLPRERIAAIHFKNGRLEKTISEYEVLKKESPGDISTMLLLGHLYMAVGDHDRAIETFNTAILIHPDNFDSTADDIGMLLAEGQSDQALRLVEEKLEAEPGRTDLMLKRADILSEMGADQDAIEQYRQLIQLCPDFLEATIKLGTLYLQMHELRQAARQFNQAVEINDRVIDAYIGLAAAEKLAGRVSDAAGILSLAAAIQPNSSLLFAETAQLQFRAIMQDQPPSHWQGEQHQPQDENLLEAVIRAHQAQISARAQNPELHYRLGVLLTSIGRLTDAAEAFHNALTINPTYTRAAAKLAICLYETGRPDQALALLAPPIVLDKRTLDLHYKTALLYCDRIRFASSLINLQNQMRAAFTAPDAAPNISVILQNMGLLDRAEAMWDSLTETANHALHTGYLFPPG